MNVRAESESSSFQEHEDVGTSQSTASTNKLEEKINKGRHSYQSSVKTVALCVSISLDYCDLWNWIGLYLHCLD